MKSLRLAIAVLIAISGICQDIVSGQEYPNKPIRILTGSAGGGNDFVARLLAQSLAPALGQSVVVENRPSNLVGEIAAKSPPDGYTLLFAGGVFAIGPLLQKMPYDPVRDFAPITLAVSSPSVLLVHPSLPVKSVKDLIALAKARPGELNYASGNSGSANHLSAELFKSLARIDILRVPYKGSGPALNDLLGGQVQLMFGGVSVYASHVKPGRLRALAVTSAQPSALIPGMPTMAASGVSGYHFSSTLGLFAPGKTPAAIVNRLNQEAVRCLNREDVKERLLTNGAEASPTSPEQYSAMMKADIATLGKVIKEAGITGE